MAQNIDRRTLYLTAETDVRRLLERTKPDFDDTTLAKVRSVGEEVSHLFRLPRDELKVAFLEAGLAYEDASGLIAGLAASFPMYWCAPSLSACACCRLVLPGAAGRTATKERLRERLGWRGSGDETTRLR